MREMGLQARRGRRRPPRTTDSRHDLPVAPNLLDRHSVADRPDAVWPADISYVPTAEGWLYLAADRGPGHAGDRRLGMADHLRAELCVDALLMALQRRRPRPACSTTATAGCSTPASPTRQGAGAARDQAVHEPARQLSGRAGSDDASGPGRARDGRARGRPIPPRDPDDPDLAGLTPSASPQAGVRGALSGPDLPRRSPARRRTNHGLRLSGRHAGKNSTCQATNSAPGSSGSTADGPLTACAAAFEALSIIWSQSFTPSSLPGLGGVLFLRCA